jgi:hypothetical protein
MVRQSKARGNPCPARTFHRLQINFAKERAMKHLLTMSAAAAALLAMPIAAQVPPPEQVAEPAVPATPAQPAVPTMEPATPATPAVPAEPSVIQANPRGPGAPTWTPPNPAAAAEPVPPAMPADPSYAAGPYKGALTPPPPEAMNKVYPWCTRTLQDSCRNRGGV